MILTAVYRRQSPTYHFFMANSSEVVIDGLSLISVSSSDNEAANTDGIGKLMRSTIEWLKLTGHRYV